MNTFLRRLVSEIGFAAVIIFPAAFIIGSLYISNWNWPMYVEAVKVSASFYFVMRLVMEYGADKMVRRLVPRTLDKPKRYFVIEITIRAAFGVAGTLISLLVAQVFTGLNFLGSLRTIYVQLFVGLVITLLVSTSIYAVVFYKEMIGRIRDAQTAQESAVKAELKALRAQVNPHFLFNTLNSISALIAIDAKKADRMTQQLAEIFRYVLLASEKDTVTLDQELTFIDTYLSIEKMRFEEKLTIEKIVDPGTNALKVPSLILQPIVENAVKHGISQNVNGGKISITSRIENDSLYITVSDNGDGSSTQKPAASLGVGLVNVDQRIKKTFGESYGLTFENGSPNGARVILRMPAIS